MYPKFITTMFSGTLAVLMMFCIFWVMRANFYKWLKCNIRLVCYAYLPLENYQTSMECPNDWGEILQMFCGCDRAWPDRDHCVAMWWTVVNFSNVFFILLWLVFGNFRHSSHADSHHQWKSMLNGQKIHFFNSFLHIYTSLTNAHIFQKCRQFTKKIKFRWIPKAISCKQNVRNVKINELHSRKVSHFFKFGLRFDIEMYTIWIYYDLWRIKWNKHQIRSFFLSKKREKMYVLFIHAWKSQRDHVENILAIEIRFVFYHYFFSRFIINFLLEKRKSNQIACVDVRKSSFFFKWKGFKTFRSEKVGLFFLKINYLKWNLLRTLNWKYFPLFSYTQQIIIIFSLPFRPHVVINSFRFLFKFTSVNLLRYFMV